MKSAIHFSAGLKGTFGNAVPFNIETLVNTLYELERNEDHPLYPFIASWNSRFVALAGPNFKAVREFRGRILERLKNWMCPDDGSQASYYGGLVTLQRDLTHPLHIFSLNYDLCVEGLQGPSFRVEKGFEAHGPNYPWDWRRFDPDPGNNPLPEVFLYKLHGSINWKRDQRTKVLYSVGQIQSVTADSMDVIFGREFKLEAADPYLFFAYAAQSKPGNEADRHNWLRIRRQPHQQDVDAEPTRRSVAAASDRSEVRRSRVPGSRGRNRVAP